VDRFTKKQDQNDQWAYIHRTHTDRHNLLQHLTHIVVYISSSEMLRLFDNLGPHVAAANWPCTYVLSFKCKKSLQASRQKYIEL